MSLDESDSGSSAPTSVAVYRDQAEQWIRAQHKLVPTQAIPDELQIKYIVSALRHSCSDENEENEQQQQELRRAIDDFQKIVLTKLPAVGHDMILAPCRKADKHAQPCLCPFLWFTVRRYPNGFCVGGDGAGAKGAEEEILSDGES